MSLPFDLNRIWRCQALPVLAAMLAMPIAISSAKPAVAAAPTLAIPASHHWLMTSAAGREFNIYLVAPTAPPPPQGYPVLYFLDADVSLGMYVQSLRLLERAGRVPPVILVGIGFRARQDIREWRGLMDRDRSYDYTPLAPREMVTAKYPDSPPHGGADELLDFIETRLKPKVDRTLPVDKTREALSGHSYGGLFTLNALLMRPASFDIFLASSPSIWFGERYLLSRQTGFPKRVAGATPRAMIMVGRDEQPYAGNLDRLKEPAERHAMLVDRRMVDNGREFAAWLEQQGVAARFRVAPDASHETAKIINLIHAMAFAFGK